MPVLHTKDDIAEENKVARILESVWHPLKFHRYPQMHQVDFFVSDGTALNSFIEMKRRYNKIAKYQTVYLSFAKWAHVRTHIWDARCAGGIVYAFDDGIYFIDIHNVDPRRPLIKGRSDRPGVATDKEPMIEIPIDALRFVCAWPVPDPSQTPNRL